jgi:ubiquinone/menaquinone biosynthesis C-methylase UbiE
VDKPKDQAFSNSHKESAYIVGYSKKTVGELNKRSAAKDAAFFLPHLSSGTDLLDCGCGPGKITVEFAQIVAPGQVVGIDIEAHQIELGRQRASELGISNIKFETSDICDLAFPPESFDAVFAHAILYHLGDPRRALREIHRVLKPGGLIGIRDVDQGGIIVSPSSPLVEKSLGLIYRTIQATGGNPLFGRSHRGILQEMGFVDIKPSASYDTYGTLESVQDLGEYMAEHILEHAVSAVIKRKGWATQLELEEMSNANREWGQHPDAFLAIARCETIAWKNK